MLFTTCAALCLFSCRKKHIDIQGTVTRLDSVAVFQGTNSAISYKFYYDQYGYVIKLVQTSPLRKFVFTDSFIYDASHRLIRHLANTSGNGNGITEHIYDAIGRLARINNPPNVGSAHVYVMLQYYVTGRPSEADIYDSSNNEYLASHFFYYDSLGNLLLQVDSGASGNSNKTAYIYDSKYNPATLLHGIEFYSIWYDVLFNRSMNNCTQRTYSTGVDKYQYEYNDNGYPTKMTADNGNGTTYTNLYFYSEH